MKENSHSLLSELLGLALDHEMEAFWNTNEGKLLAQRRARWDEDCKCFFTPDDLEVIQENTKDMLHLESRKQEYAYRQGMRDAVALLKFLGVLA